MKHSVGGGAGIVDQDYSEEIGVIIFNHSKVEFPVKEVDKIAQLILEEIRTLKMMELLNL